jgi:hypothetical protein
MSSVEQPAASASAAPAARVGAGALLSIRRIAVMLLAAVPIALLISIDSKTPLGIWVARTVIVGLGALVAFGLAERYPARLPRWVGRWFFQLLATALAIPASAYLAYWVTVGGNPAFVANPARFVGFGQLTAAGLFFGLWMALGAMVRQRDAQALAFERERNALQSEANDARLQLLRARIEPHFLFNTLANVQALVESGSPNAPRVLASLISYLKAAVPQLEQPVTTIGREAELARAYLELMQMRMPDRLQFSMAVEPDTLALRCPPTALLVLVENAVRHGIDPSEEGGAIDITVRREEDAVLIRVTDSGVGPGVSMAGLGTGLKALRERLQLVFGDRAVLRLSEREPHGVVAEVQFPAQVATS